MTLQTPTGLFDATESTTSDTAYSTGALAPSGNALVVAAFNLYNYDGNDSPVVTSAFSTTSAWSVLESPSLSGGAYTIVAYATTPATPGGGTVTVTAGGSDEWDRIVAQGLEYTDDSGNPPEYVQSDITQLNFGGSFTSFINGTLAAWTAGSFGFYGAGGGSGYYKTPDANWTEVYDRVSAGSPKSANLQICYTSTEDTVPIGTWSSTNNACKQLISIEVGTPSSAPTTDFELDVVTFLMNPGSVLDLSKTITDVNFTMVLKPLTVEVTGSTNAQTLPIVTTDISPRNLVVGIELPAIVLNFSPQAFDTVGFVLGAIQILFKPLVGTQWLVTSPGGLKEEQRKLIKRGKGLMRKSAARAAEDLINVIVTETEGDDYRKDS